jgi:hypothetical protein
MPTHRVGFLLNVSIDFSSVRWYNQSVMEVVRFPSRGGFSVRSILTFVLAVFVAALLWAILLATPTQAQGSTSATWTDGGVILYDNHGYNLATDLTDTTGTIPSGSTIYKSPVQSTGTATSSRILILFFSPGVDPPTATSAKYVEFNYNNGRLSQAQNAKDISLAPQGTSDSVNSSCAVEGIGWMICPISVFLAEAMDNLFTILSGMIAVQPPILGDENNSMYVAWNVMRSIANLAFVIVFLIIIFSQLTSLGVSNYGLKKLIPRLIIAAVLVNVSFYIAALAIDVSNIAGYSIQNIFNGIRENIFHVTNDNLTGVASDVGWGKVTGVVLAGGGLIGGSYFVANGGLALLVPLLVGLGLTVLFVVLIFAARQAIILILVIIAPLAFVANLLPNTEKWFDKWKDLFITMLIFFPAFSLVFGGSQLAGQIIIQNAGDNIVSLLFGMAVQIAPLVITPLILKLSGGLLGRIAQIANDPRKGVLDRSKNWAQKRAELTRNNSVRDGARARNLFGGGMVRYAQGRKVSLDKNIEVAKQEAENVYTAGNRQYNGNNGILIRKTLADTRKSELHDHHNEHLEDLKRNGTSPLYGASINAQSAKERFEASQNSTNSMHNHQRTIAGTALNASSNYLEYSKMSFESSESEKTIYQMNQKLTTGTVLNGAVDRLETGKLRVERKQSQYTAMVDGMKVDTTTDVYNAGLGAAAAKELAEAAQNTVTRLYNEQRIVAGTGLNRSSNSLELTKTTLETSENNRTDYITRQKLNPASPLNAAVQAAQTSKQQSEGAQNLLQSFFDEQNRAPGSAMNISYVELESSKSVAERSKGELTEYTAKLRNTKGTLLHQQTIEAEQAKTRGQIAESDLAKTFEEYKAGAIDINTLTVPERALMQQMKEDTARLTAINQGTTSAKYVQQEYYSSLMAEDAIDPIAPELIQSAAGVDPNGEVRARANASSQLEKLQKESLSNNLTLISDRAEHAEETLVNYSKGIYNQHNGLLVDDAGNPIPAVEQDPSILEAAMEALAQDGQVSILRKARMNRSMDQNMLTRLFARNSATLKAKGAFDLQANPKLAGASQEMMDASTAGSLGDITASGIASQKGSWWEEVGERIEDLYTSADSVVYNAEDVVDNDKKHDETMKKLRDTYQNMTIALRNANVLKDIGDRLEPTIKIHQYLHSQFNDEKMAVDYDAARRGETPKPRTTP